MASTFILTRQEAWRAAAGIAAALAAWGMIRLVFPSLDYYPPEGLVQSLERSWFVISATQTAAKVAYGLATLALMAAFFAVLRCRWAGRTEWNGLLFGVLLGILWAFGFLASSAFFGTTLGAELLNGVLDLAALAFGGWLVGLALKRSVPSPELRSRKPWPAIFFIAVGFVAAHILGTLSLRANFGQAAVLLPRPETALQYATLFLVGLWAGVMYVVLRAGLPFDPAWASPAFFAFGIFGHSWTLFKLYLVIEFGNVLLPLFLIGFVGSVGVFIGAFVYEFAVEARLLRERA